MQKLYIIIIQLNDLKFSDQVKKSEMIYIDFCLLCVQELPFYFKSKCSVKGFCSVI